MSFPSSPSNGQSAVVNGITYTYNSTNNTWTRVSNVNSALTIYDDEFTGDGSSTQFTLSTQPYNETFVTATVDGVSQLRSTYTVASNIITFDSAFESGSKIGVTTLSGNTTINTGPATGKAIAMAVVFGS